MSLDHTVLQSFQSLLLGFAFAGLIASAFELFTERRASFRLLEKGGIRALACVPLVVFSAPFIIVRNTVKGTAVGDRPFFFVFAATIIACLWSLLSGRIVLDIALTILR